MEHHNKVLTPDRGELHGNPFFALEPEIGGFWRFYHMIPQNVYWRWLYHRSVAEEPCASSSRSYESMADATSAAELFAMNVMHDEFATVKYPSLQDVVLVLRVTPSDRDAKFEWLVVNNKALVPAGRSTRSFDTQESAEEDARRLFKNATYIWVDGK